MSDPPGNLRQRAPTEHVISTGATEAFSPERAALYQAAASAFSSNVSGLRRLFDAFGSLEAALSAPLTAAAQALEADEGKARRQLTNLRLRLPVATRQVRAALAAGLQILTWEDAGYPPALHHDPVGCAPLLYVQGQLPAQLGYGSDAVRACAVVGTRRATQGALAFARDLARALSREGVLVVSGLAIGIDAAAHVGALQAQDQVQAQEHAQEHVQELAEAQEYAASGGGARPLSAQRRYDWVPGAQPTPRPAGTVAVLGGGHGRLHPAGHAGLARRIVESGGAVVSLWPPDFTPRRYTFLQRNRVISGLARLVVVVEAGANSGTNNTVAHALDQGRKVMAVPGAPWSVTGAGCFAFLRDGAVPLFEYPQVLEYFKELAPGAPVESGADGASLTAHAKSGSAQPALGFPDGAAVAAASSSAQVVADLRRVMASGGEFALDTLSARTHHGATVLIGALATLEHLGEVEATAGGRFRLRDARIPGAKKTARKR